MRLGNVNVELLEKGAMELVKRAIAGALITTTLAGYTLYFEKTGIRRAIEISHHTDFSQEITAQADQIEYTIDENNKNNRDNRLPISPKNMNAPRDISGEYNVIYIGDKSLDLASNNFISYKNTDNAFTRSKSGLKDETAHMSEDAYSELDEYLDSQQVSMPYGELFNVEHLINKQTYEPVSHGKTIDIKGGSITGTQLYKIVRANNKKYNYYNAFRDSELKDICEVIATSVNYAIKNNPYLDLEALLCNLSHLKIFKEEHATNARITDDFVLALSPATIKKLQSSIVSLDVFGLTVSHEASHLPQLACVHEVDTTIETRVGITSKWKDEAINSLFWSWFFEAGAESTVMNEHQTSNIVYTAEINYLKYLKLVISTRDGFTEHALENVSSSRDIDDFFKLFGIESKSDKIEFAKMMYAIELVLNESAEFESIYKNYTGKLEVTKEDWQSIKSELKSAIAINLSAMFYRNLATQVRKGTLTLNDVFYLITVFEAEIESHNIYDSLNRFDSNRCFMDTYVSMQNAFFSPITTASLSYEEILEAFDRYSYNDPTNLSGLDDNSKDFIRGRGFELVSSTTTNIRTFYEVLSRQNDMNKTLDMN